MLSKRLGPSAKKIAMRSTLNETVSTVIQVAPSIDRQAFETSVVAQGGSVRSWLPEANLATVDIGAHQLSELADLAGVVQVEAGQKYQNSAYPVGSGNQVDGRVGIDQAKAKGGVEP